MSADKRFLRWAPIAALLGSLACAGCHSTEEVRIGFVGDLSSELGVGGRNGAELALFVLNEKEEGRYRLVVKDDRNDSNVVQSSVASLAAERVAFIVGPMTSSMAVAAVPVANRMGVVVISPTATTDELSGKDDFFFRPAADVRTGARLLAGVLRRRQIHSLVVLMDVTNASYSLSFGRAVLNEFVRSGRTSVKSLSYRSGNSLEFSAALATANAERPEGIVLVDGPTDAGIACRQLRETLPGAVIALSPWAANDQYLMAAGASSAGTIGLRAVDLDSSLPSMREFVARYRARYGVAPTTPAAQAYEAVMLGMQGLKKAGPKTLRTALSAPGRRFGLDGDFEMDAYGDAQRPLLPVEVRAGRFERVKQDDASASGASLAPMAH